jgi:hypothetical protein
MSDITPMEAHARLAFIEERLSDYDMQMNYTPVYGHGSIEEAMTFLEDERELLEEMLWANGDTGSLSPLGDVP